MCVQCLCVRMRGLVESPLNAPSHLTPTSPFWPFVEFLIEIDDDATSITFTTPKASELPRRPSFISVLEAITPLAASPSPAPSPVETAIWPGRGLRFAI